ncbi:hypothetical protein [Erythrobacter rubeus]|uniref:Integron n=1 Tax=Erythrobacter rubeus TaxID=2760803 RepID=A0ABR8KPJ4_9SPHN|nr:hypothetical protein [Erythrobacter rubeus]MBD2841784.1 hypothetical protein [Erythrobacter rubeus]
MTKDRSRLWFGIIAAALTVTACAQGDERDTTAPTARTIDAGTPPRPVQIGFDGPRFDACAGYGRVTNLNASSDRELPVRSAPSGSADEVDRLAAGRGVSMCQQVGNWIGIVYAPAGEGENQGQGEERCGTGSPVPSVRAYEGPCKSGWVNENFIELIAS